MICKNCGTNYEGDFCENCISTTVIENTSFSTIEKFLHKKKIKGILIAVILILILCVFLLFCSSSPHSSPKAIINAWEDAINDRDSSKLYSIAADVQHGSNTELDYILYLDNWEREYGKDFKVNVKAGRIEYEEDDFATSTIRITIKSNGSTFTNTEEAMFSKINGKWYWED